MYGWLWPGPSSLRAYCGLSIEMPSALSGTLREDTEASSLRVVSGLLGQGRRTAACADFSTDLPALVTCPVIVTVPLWTATGLLTDSMVMVTGSSALTAVSATGLAPPAGAPPAGAAPAVPPGSAEASTSAAPSAPASRRTVRPRTRPGRRSGSGPGCRAGSLTRFALAHGFALAVLDRCCCCRAAADVPSAVGCREDQP